MPRNAEVLFPYLNGEDLNQRPDASASRWVIDFNDRSEVEAAPEFGLPYRARNSTGQGRTNGEQPKGLPRLLVAVRGEAASHAEGDCWVVGSVGHRSCQQDRHARCVSQLDRSSSEKLRRVRLRQLQRPGSLVIKPPPVVGYHVRIDYARHELRYTPSDVFETRSRAQRPTDRLDWYRTLPSMRNAAR